MVHLASRGGGGVLCPTYFGTPKNRDKSLNAGQPKITNVYNAVYLCCSDSYL